MGPESSAANDVSLFFQWLDGGVTTNSNTVTITVTPLINLFNVTRAAGQNINFFDQNPVDGLKGLKAYVPGNPNAPGATFNADVTTTNLAGSAVFIQNITAVANGANGSAAGWIFTPASGLANENLVLLDANGNPVAVPVLDVLNPPGPEYDVNFVYTTNTPNKQVAQADDSPRTGWAANPVQTSVIDVRYSLKLYLVWKYPSGIYYPIANMNWSANFFADTNAPGVGVTNIRSPQGVTANPYTRGNAVPVLVQPVFNSSGFWR